MKKKDEKEEKKSISEVTQEGKEELLSPPKKRRGRPKKEEIPESSGVEAEAAEPVLKEEKKKKRSVKKAVKDSSSEDSAPSELRIEEDNSLFTAYKETQPADAPEERITPEKTDEPVKKEGPRDADAKAVQGILEIMSEGYGFMRSENFLPGEQDVYVNNLMIRRFHLKTGDMLYGYAKSRNPQERYSALLYIEKVNNLPISALYGRPDFDKLTPIFPDERIPMEREGKRVSTSLRVLDLLAPIGKGQRGMIVSPPKAGKTTLLKQIAQSILQNEPDMTLLILLIDERPEEVTDMMEEVVGDKVQVIYSTFDELPEHHKRVAEMTTRFFGAARNIREGGSLTILATALVDTGSRMDDVIYEEFKGTGNMELVLNRELQERRIFPAIDIQKSGTRRDDLLLSPLEKDAADFLHRELSSDKKNAVEDTLSLFDRTLNNIKLCETLVRGKTVTAPERTTERDENVFVRVNKKNFSN